MEILYILLLLIPAIKLLMEINSITLTINLSTSKSVLILLNRAFPITYPIQTQYFTNRFPPVLESSKNLTSISLHMWDTIRNPKNNNLILIISQTNKNTMNLTNTSKSIIIIKHPIKPNSLQIYRLTNPPTI